MQPVVDAPSWLNCCEQAPIASYGPTAGEGPFQKLILVDDTSCADEPLLDPGWCFARISDDCSKNNWLWSIMMSCCKVVVPKLDQWVVQNASASGDSPGQWWITLCWIWTIVLQTASVLAVNKKNDNIFAWMISNLLACESYVVMIQFAHAQAFINPWLWITL